MSKLKLTLAALAVLIGVATLTPSYAMASPASQIRKGVNDVGGNSKDCTDAAGKAVKCSIGRSIKTVVNVMLYILGAIAVVMIVIGGIRYTTSAGDSSSTKAAKDTILYAVVGLVVALLAYAIVNFVLNSFS